jgi:hypothetical protein
MWSVPAHVSYLNPPLTDEMVRDAEKKLKVRLPRSYIDLLRVQNGGYVERDIPARGEGAINLLYGIGPHFPTILERDWREIKGYMKENGIKVPTKIDFLVPFSGDGHYYYCFDYRRTGKTAEPEISFIDVEVFNIDYVVAANFTEFLKSLKQEPIPRIGIQSELDYGSMVKFLGGVLEVEFKQSDLHLDPQYFAKYPPSRFGIEADNDHYFPAIWLNANRVQRAYKPKDDFYDKGYEYLFDEYGFRQSHYAEFAYFLSCVRDQDLGYIAAWLRERGVALALVDSV